MARAGRKPGAREIACWLAAATGTLLGAAIGAPADRNTEHEPVTSALSCDAEALAKFLARPDEPSRAFRAHRRLEIRGGALGKKAWMEVQVDVDPKEGFRYRVLAAGGSEMLQDKILHKVLRAEQQVYAEGANSLTALTADNYLLAAGGCDAKGLARLLATARRKELGLLNGQFLVTRDTADLVEVSGTMAKAPSFWIPRVEMTKRYARVQGHRMNVRVDSVSHVRLLGESHFTMTTEYQSIDGDTIPPVGAASAGGP